MYNMEIQYKIQQTVFLAAQSSSRTTVVGPLVRWSVGLLVRPSVMFVKRWPLEYVIKIYLPTYLWDSSDSSDSWDSSNSSDSSDNSDSSYQTTFWLTFCD